MEGIFNIAGVNEAPAVRRVEARDPKAEKPTAAQQQDSVAVSEDARKAAEAVRLVEKSRLAAEIREKKVAEAKENIAQGAYRVNEVVLRVAARISDIVG